MLKKLNIRLFLSGKKAILSYERCVCFTVIDSEKRCECKPSFLEPGAC